MAYTWATTGDLLTYAGHSASNSLTQQSWSFWVLPRTALNVEGNSSLSRVWVKGNGSNAGDAIWARGSEYSTWRWSGGQVTWAWTVPTVGVWNHYAITYDASSTGNKPAVWLNGLPVAVNSPAVSGTWGSNTSDVLLGNFTGGTRTFDGRLAEVAHWGAILSEAEARSLYRVSSAGGFRTSDVRPDALRFYAPLLRSTEDVVTRLRPSQTGNIASSPHPFYPQPRSRIFRLVPLSAGAVSASYLATLGDLSFSGTASRTLPASAAATYSATLGNLTAALTATFTAAPNRSATYAATLGDTTFAGVAARTLPPNATATYTATLGDTTLAAVASRTLPANATATYTATLGDTTASLTASRTLPASATGTYAATLGDTVLAASASASGVAGTTGVFRVRSVPRIKPVACRLGDDPITDGLLSALTFHEGNGEPIGLVTGQRTTLSVGTGTVTWQPGPFGRAYSSNTLGGTQSLTVPAKTFDLARPFSVALLITPRTFAGSPFISALWTSSSPSGVAFFRIGDATLANNQPQFVVNTTTKLNAVGTIPANAPALLVATTDLTQTRIYINGRLDATGTHSAMTGTLNSTVLFRDDIATGFNRGPDAQFHFFGLWQRCLQPGEVARLWAEPLAVLGRKRPVYFAATGFNASYAATLGDTTFAGVASRALPANAAGTYAATLGDTVLTATATRTLPASATAAYTATLGNTVFAGVASRALPANATATFAATLGSVVLVGTAGDFSALALYPTRLSGPVTVSQTGGFFGPVTIRGVEKLDGLVTVIDTIDPDRTSVRVK